MTSGKEEAVYQNAPLSCSTYKIWQGDGLPLCGFWIKALNGSQYLQQFGNVETSASYALTRIFRDASGLEMHVLSELRCFLKQKAAQLSACWTRVDYVAK